MPRPSGVHISHEVRSPRDYRGGTRHPITALVLSRKLQCQARYYLANTRQNDTPFGVPTLANIG